MTELDVSMSSVSTSEGSSVIRRSPVLMGDVRYQILHRFYLEEAVHLDDNDLEAWREMLDPRLSYRMAVRTERLRRTGGPEASASFHMEENHATILLRIRRLLDSNNAWSEDPATRTRRFVSNLMVDETEHPDILFASTYLLLVRNHGDDFTYEFLSARRKDLLAFADVTVAPKLVDRTITVDQLRIGVRNLALFL
jgi:3-phenylpropionate/cinnamic acid dioxygenase small subunit